MRKYGWIVLALSVCSGQVKSGSAERGIHEARKASVEQGLRLPVFFGERHPQLFSVDERLSHYKVPGISFALIDEGRLAWASAYGNTAAGSDDKVTVNTVFQAASIAKPVTAYAAMRMQEQGVIDINKGINQYLTSLTLPKGKQTHEAEVTFKNLLDHTSGLTAGGYLGYKRGQAIPTDLQTFLGAEPANSKTAEVEILPGTEVRYSGAGYTLAEIALGDVFEQPFERVMEDWVLSPLAMQNSGFDMALPQSDKVSVALGHDSKGVTVEGGWHVHPEQAAAGL